MQVQLAKQEAIAEITRRLVEFYSPVRIYLFGSAARGDDGPDSDLDFLVVLPTTRLAACTATAPSITASGISKPQWMSSVFP